MKVGSSLPRIQHIYVNDPHLEHLRIACDLMNFYFAFNEYTDVANKSDARKIANDVMDVFRHREGAYGLSPTVK